MNEYVAYARNTESGCNLSIKALAHGEEQLEVEKGMWQSDSQKVNVVTKMARSLS